MTPARLVANEYISTLEAHFNPEASAIRAEPRAAVVKH
jgi:hypothetical protein